MNLPLSQELKTTFAANTCQLPHANEQYTVKVKYIPTIPDNIDYWQVCENEKQIEDFLQPKTKFEMPKSNSDHQEDCLAEEQTHKTRLSCTANINLLEHPLEAELVEDLDKRDLEVLQHKDNLFTRGLAPLE